MLTPCGWDAHSRLEDVAADACSSRMPVARPSANWTRGAADDPAEPRRRVTMFSPDHLTALFEMRACFEALARSARNVGRGCGRRTSPLLVTTSPSSGAIRIRVDRPHKRSRLHLAAGRSTEGADEVRRLRAARRPTCGGPLIALLASTRDGAAAPNLFTSCSTRDPRRAEAAMRRHVESQRPISSRACRLVRS